MEFLRFGSSIPGAYWGCCAADIIQDFNQSPDDKVSIQLVDGDGGMALVSNDGKELLFAGPTLRDVFWQRIRFGTFGKRDMPNHAFFAILTENQVNGSIGKQWLAILKEAGFEFVRTVCNSVYAGQSIIGSLPASGGSSKNHIFALFRNIGSGAIADPFTPPSAWQKLPPVSPEAWTTMQDTPALVQGQFAAQKQVWDTHAMPPLLSETEAKAAGSELHLAGLRSENPQEPKSSREARTKYKNELQQKSLKAPVAVAPTAV